MNCRKKNELSIYLTKYFFSADLLETHICLFSNKICSNKRMAPNNKLYFSALLKFFYTSRHSSERLREFATFFYFTPKIIN